MKYLPSIIVVTVVGLGLVGCSSQEATVGALGGAAVGAGAGAVIGNQSGNSGEGAAIGGVAGAMVGGALGEQAHVSDKATADLDETMRRQEAQRERQDREIEDLRRQKLQDENYRSWVEQHSQNQ